MTKVEKRRSIYSRLFIFSLLTVMCMLFPKISLGAAEEVEISNDVPAVIQETSAIPEETVESSTTEDVNTGNDAADELENSVQPLEANDSDEKMTEAEVLESKSTNEISSKDNDSQEMMDKDDSQEKDLEENDLEKEDSESEMMTNKSSRSGSVEVETEITDFTITKSDGTSTSGEVGLTERIRFYIDWDASKNGANLKKDNYFTINLPDEFKIYVAQPMEFPLMSPDDKIMANAEATMGDGGVGGSIKVIFTDYVEEKENIKGKLFMYAYLNEKLVKVGESNTIDTSIGSYTESVDIVVKPPGTLSPEEHLSKWAGGTLDSNGNINWVMRLNYAKSNLNNAVIKDTVSVDPATGTMDGIHYIEDSFILKEVEISDTGVMTVLNSTPITVDFNEDKTSFTYNLGDISGKQYRLDYKTTFKPGQGLVVKNSGVLINDEEEWIKATTFKEVSGGGTGEGDLTNKIKIIKVDLDDNNIKLKGAQFEVTKLSDGTKFTLVTGDNGEVISGSLSQGKYLIKEIVAPEGYILNDQEFEVTLTTEGKTITITNAPIGEETPDEGSIDIDVTKKWEGKSKESVTINLYADGKKVDSKVITEAMGWKYTFKDLDEYKEGKKIIYTIDEEYIKGYTVNITGGVENGFVVTNKKETKPEKPQDPEDPDEPDEPEDPEDPEDPEEPDEPAKPVDPKEPMDPDEPTKPEGPTEPKEPVKPEEPKVPGVLSDIATKTTSKAKLVSSAAKGGVPKTGDSFNYILHLAVLAVSGAALILLVYLRRRNFKLMTS